MKFLKRNKDEYIANEIDQLKKQKELKLLDLQDYMHDYAMAKKNSKFSLKGFKFSFKKIDKDKLVKDKKGLLKSFKFSFKKIDKDKLVENKRVLLKKRTRKINKDYESSIKNLKSKKDWNYWGLYFTQWFRRIGFNNLIKNIFKIINENKLMIIILLIAIIAGSIRPVFYSKYNLLNNILKNNATIGIMAIGMTFVILTGGIDLSVGSLLGFTGILSMGMMLGGMSTILAFLIGFLIAFLLGALQGFLIAWIKLPPFIVTLVGLLSIRGAVYIYAKGSPKTDVGNSVFDFINDGKLLGMPFLVWILILFVIIGVFVLKYTHFGRKVYSVGGNVEASKLSGINTKKIILICYSISGLMAGVGALAFVSKISSAGPTSGNSYELDVIAAVVLGGTSLSGGKGGVGKTFLGWLVISILANSLILLDFDSNWQLVFKGIVILIAVILDKNLNILNKFKKIKNKIF